MAVKACVKGQAVAAAATATSQVTCYAAEGKGCEKTQFADMVEELSSGSDGSGADTDDASSVDHRLICAYHEECPIGFAVFLAATSTSQVECTDCRLKGEGPMKGTFYSDERTTGMD